MLIFSNVLMFILGFPIHFQMNLCKYLRRSQFHYIEFLGEDNSTISPQMMMMRTTSKMRMRMVTCRSNTKANRKDLLRKLSSCIVYFFMSYKQCYSLPRTKNVRPYTEKGPAVTKNVFGLMTVSVEFLFIVAFPLHVLAISVLW